MRDSVAVPICIAGLAVSVAGFLITGRADKHNSYWVDSEPYSFVCFDQWQNSTRRPGVVQHTLKDGGVYVLKREDGTTSYYMQQHGEDCYPEETAQKRAHTKKVK